MVARLHVYVCNEWAKGVNSFLSPKTMLIDGTNVFWQNRAHTSDRKKGLYRAIDDFFLSDGGQIPGLDDL